ncbi:shikimate kinase [Schaalia vaccimaxillae]|uniref:shikimate kinase n=1 Tax=Schaalia vaccimaxillae TaxID=183916 RepID=UPI0003B6EC18|nr:shikimate kinase [Schaalia vaccimaxillae]
MTTVQGEPLVPQLVLVGVSGSGKTTVGRIISQRVGLAFIDVDEAVEERLGTSMADLVVNFDPRLNEAREQEALRALSTGGAVCTLGASQINVESVRHSLRAAQTQGALVVELVAGIAHVSRRQGLNGPRSVALGAPRAVLAQMIAQLHESYVAVADHSVLTDGFTPDEVADAVMAACRLADD